MYWERGGRTGFDAVVKEISATGGKAIGFATDVTKRAEVEALIKRAVEGLGRGRRGCAKGNRECW